MIQKKSLPAIVSEKEETAKEGLEKKKEKTEKA